MELIDKYYRLVATLKRDGHGAVAFSGGVDSSLLLKAAVDAFGKATQPFFVRSILQKRGVLERVKQTCREVGCSLRIIDLNPLGWPEFVVNSDLRCYHCKKKMYFHLLSLLPPGFRLLDGTNLDDISRHRPGLGAIEELGVGMPLVEAGLTKREIRTLCRSFNLSVWDLPAESCLATRIVSGIPITLQLLQKVDAGECFLVEKGLHGCRVRLDGRSVFVSLSEGESGKLLSGPVRAEVIKFFAKINYPKVFLELSERPGILSRY